MHVGQLIAGRFLLEEAVGSGGMGEVFRAKDEVSGGSVAVKVLRAPLKREGDRFRREAQLLSEVAADTVVRYVSHGLTEQSCPYLVMEWLSGRDLAERLADGGLNLRETLVLGLRILDALALLHARGVVHRDVKPSNLFLVSDAPGEAKLLDFGLARLAGLGPLATQPGAVVGTPGYMAPEQVRGLTSLDARVDIFSLGAVLFECLTGRPAFAGDFVPALLAKTLLEDPPRVGDYRPEIPKELDGLVHRMMAKSPDARPPSVEVVAKVLRALSTTAPSGDRVVREKPSRALTTGERRLVSVIMASGGPYRPTPTDVTSSSETQVAQLDLSTVVASFGAEVECMSDGTILICMTGQGTANDQVVHAARCALSVREHVPEAPMVLATGLAVFSNEAFSGDVIDRAAALLHTARTLSVVGADETARFSGAPRHVRIDDTSAGLLDERFDVGGDAHGLSLRGIREQVARPRTLLGKTTTCVGRERELAALRSLFDECAGEPVARVVLVTAESGIGKSRLVQEFLDRVVQKDPVEVWRARGDPLAAGSPFGLLAQLVRRTAGMFEGEPLVVRQHKLRARLSRHLGGDMLVFATEFLGELVGAPVVEEPGVRLRAARRDALLMGDQMCLAFIEWLSAECRNFPVAIVFEDLHWGDLPTIRYVDAALRTLCEQSLMVVGIARPDVHEKFPRLWAERGVQEIRLAPLTRKASEKLVRDTLGNVADTDLSWIVERASKNTYLLEEIIRAFAAGRRDGLPETVLAMVEARLARLDPSARRMLRAASVFGDIFWRGGVRHLVGASEPVSQVNHWLTELQNQEVIARRQVARIASDDAFGFQHSSVREAAYAMLTEEDRTLGHRLAGEWLLLVGETEAAILAEHFERGAVPERAAEWYQRASLQALEGNDLALAVKMAERAILCGVSPEVKGHLRYVQAEAEDWRGEPLVAVRYAEEAYALLEEGSGSWYLAGGLLADLYWRKGDRGGLVRLGRAFCEVASVAPLSVGRVMGGAHVASHLFYSGEREVAEPLLIEIEVTGKEIILREPTAAAWVYFARANRAAARFEIEDEIECTRLCMEQFERVGDVRNVCRHRLNLGVALSQVGEWQDAEWHLRRAIDDATRLGLLSAVLAAKHNLGGMLSRAGRAEEGFVYEREAVSGFHAIGEHLMEAAARGYLGVMLYVQGALEEARNELLFAVGLVEGAPSLRAGGLSVLGLVELGLGRPEVALAYAKEAIALLESSGVFVEAEAYVRLSYAEALHETGAFEQARAAILHAKERLLERASHIRSATRRAGFLEKPREHARTLALADLWLGADRTSATT